MGNDSSRRSPLRSLRAFASSALLVLALSFAIAWPLWSLATMERRAFTLAALAAAALAVLFLALRPIFLRAAYRAAMRHRASMARREEP